MANQVELSFSIPQNFIMTIDILPEVEFTCQRVQIPTVSGEESPLSNPYNPNKTFIPGEGTDYSPLSVDFIIDKHFINYQSVLNWIKACGKPDGFEQFSNYVNNSSQIKRSSKFSKLMSNVTVIGTDAGLTPLVEWNFIDCFPIDLDGPQFDATLIDIEYFQTAVSFRYAYFEFTTYTNGARNNDTI